MLLRAGGMSRCVVVLSLVLAGVTRADPGAEHAARHAHYAEARLQLAEARLHKAQQLNEKTPGLLTAADLRLFEIKAEIASIRLALLEDPAFLDSPLDVMQLQIDQLADLILDTADHLDAAPTLERR